MQETELIESIIKSNEIKQKIWETYAREEAEKEEEDVLRKSINHSSSISRFNCPACGNSMVSDNRKPIALSPCGHSVCSICLTQDTKYCPVCKKLISQKATNFSLLQIGETMNEKHSDIPDYKRQFEEVESRMQDLFDALEKNEKSRKALQAS